MFDRVPAFAAIVQSCCRRSVSAPRPRASEMTTTLTDRMPTFAGSYGAGRLAYYFPLPRSGTDWLALSASSWKVNDDDFSPTDSGANWTTALHF